MKSYVSLFLLAGVLLLGITDDGVPNFKLKNLSNEKVELKELLEQGPVVLDFWATWCKPCVKAFPELNSLYKKFKDRGLTVVGVNEDGSRSQAKVKPFVNSFKIAFPIVMDENNQTMRKFQAHSLPTTLLISADGEVVYRHTGFSPESMQKLEQKIEELLGKSKES